MENARSFFGSWMIARWKQDFDVLPRDHGLIRQPSCLSARNLSG